MTKSDKSIHNICIASIKRSTIKPYDFKWTNFYESNSDFQNTNELQIHIEKNELIICSTFIDQNNYSILTTQRLITRDKGIDNTGSLVGATDKSYGIFKEYREGLFTFGVVQLQNGSDLKYFIETGKASMIMIHGIRTFIITTMQVDKVKRIWDTQNEKQS